MVPLHEGFWSVVTQPDFALRRFPRQGFERKVQRQRGILVHQRRARSRVAENEQHGWSQKQANGLCFGWPKLGFATAGRSESRLGRSERARLVQNPWPEASEPPLLRIER
jgi:hypothetical protein